MNFVGTRRSLLLAASFLLLVYLGLNLLLNVSYLPGYLQERAETLSGRDARVSYLYLNWRGNAVADRVDVGLPDPGSPRSNPDLTMEEVEVSLRWWSLLTEGPGRAVRRITIDHVRSRVAGLPAGGAGSNGSPPDVPVRVRRWRVDLIGSSRGPLTLRGDSAFLSRNRTIRLHVDRVGGKRADVQLLAGPDGVEAHVHHLALPDSFWAMEGDRWSGRVNLRARGGGFRLAGSLSGTPGRVRGVQLPSTQLSVDLQVGDTATVVNDVSLASSFLRVSMVGTVEHSPLRLDLRGEGRAPLKRQFQRVFFRDVAQHVNLEGMSPLRTQFRVSGGLDDLTASGEVAVDTATLRIRAGRRSDRLTLSDLSGEVGYGEVRLTGGRGQLAGGDVQLEGGRLSLRQGVFLGDVTLAYRREKAPTGFLLPGRVTRALGDLDRVHLPLETAFRVGPRRAEARVSLRGGVVEFERMAFRELRGRSEMTSEGAFNPRVRGTLRDADDNLWRVSGRVFGPLFLRGRQVTLNRWMDVVNVGASGVPDGTVVEGIDVRGVLQESTRDTVRYSLTADFDEARLRWAERWLNLAGRMEARVGELHLRDVRVTGRSGSALRVRGDYRPGEGPDGGQLDLKFEGSDVPVVSWWPTVPPSVRDVEARLDVEGRLDGTLGAPRYQAGFHRGSMEAPGLSVQDIHGRVEGDQSGLRARVNRLRLREGGGTVALEWTFNGDLGVSGGLRSVSPGSLVPEGSWVDENATGHLDADVTLEGRPIAAESWSGTVALRGRDLRLSRFPPVEEIEEIARIEALKRPIEIDPVRVKLPVRSGQLSLDPLRLNARNLSLRAKGNIGVDGRLGLRFELVLERALLQRFLQDVLGDLYREVGLNEEARRLTIPFVVSGTLSEPEVDLKRDEINKNFRENLVNSLVTEHLGKPLNELLEEIPFLR